MPWCPRCDEVFPSGIACPRCRARLLPSSESGRAVHSLQPVEGLPTLKVPRRYRRAFDRLSTPKPPPQRVLLVAGASLLFAVGFLFGRVGDAPTSDPAVRALPKVDSLATIDVEGWAAYLLWNARGDITVAAHDLYAGDLTPRTTFGSPHSERDDRTQMNVLGRNLALVLGAEESSFVAVVPDKGAPFGWIPGTDAVWVSSSTFLVRSADGRVARWSTDRSTPVRKIDGRYDEIFQTSAGAVLKSGVMLTSFTEEGLDETIVVPTGAHVLAVAPDLSRAIVVVDDQVSLWDGHEGIPLRMDGYEPLSASFSGSEGRSGIVVRRENGDLAVAVVDPAGGVALKPVPAGVQDCVPTLAWDGRGKWAYVAPGNGSLYAVDSTAGRVESVRTRLVGCGIAWFG